MTWQAPKLSWKTNPTNPVPDDFNRIEGNIAFLKEEIETKKGVIAEAINDMNQPATITDTHAQLAAKIRDISKDADAAVANVLSGKTFYQGGLKRTGTMPNRGSVGTQIISTQHGEYAIQEGYHNGQGKVRATFANLAPENVKSGVNIGGIIGTYNLIKSIQHISISLSNSESIKNVPISTISALDSVLLINGFKHWGTDMYWQRLRLSLHNSYVTAQRTNANTIVQAEVTVIEFNSGVVKSKQSGTFYSEGAGGTVSISPVDPAKTMVFEHGFNTETSSPGYLTTAFAMINLVDSTTLNVVFNTSANTYLNWEVVEFN
jgi:hypothetical protein